MTLKIDFEIRRGMIVPDVSRGRLAAPQHMYRSFSYFASDSLHITKIAQFKLIDEPRHMMARF
jgi:hypothetical protein